MVKPLQRRHTLYLILFSLTVEMAQLPTVLTLLQGLSCCPVYSQLLCLDYVNYSCGFLDLEDHFA